MLSMLEEIAPQVANNASLVSEPVKVFILAVIQGIAEFLPISSSGHLVVTNALIGTGEGTAELNIILHFGTLVAIVVFYWRRILDLLKSDRRVIPLLIVGTIPAVVIGLIIKKKFDWITEDSLLAGFMLPITGLILILLTRFTKGEKEYQQITFKTAILIGFAQAFAILPGISRSGSTIVAGAMLGLKQQSAATFSFLLAIPVILGATVLELKDIYEKWSESQHLEVAPPITETPVYLLVAGAVISFFVGLVALRWLVTWIEKGKLHWFSYWLIPFGFAIVVWQLYLRVSAG